MALARNSRSKLGSNPFKYGLEGGTDFHSGFHPLKKTIIPVLIARRIILKKIIKLFY
jgi:hypothetical protein